MAIKLWVVANATTASGTLTNTEHDYDPTNIPASAVVHTGGRDGDYIRIPDCSESKYYADHHILISAPGWTVALWNNDAQGHKLYWSAGDFYSEQHPVQGSDGYEACSILIQQTDSGVAVFASPF